MDTTTTAKPDYKKVATIAAVIGMLLIAAAGWLTASDHFARADTACALAPKLGPVAPGDELQVLDVASPGAPNEAVVALGKPLCVTIANVRTASDVQAVNADVVTAKADHDATLAELRKARTERRTATAEAGKAIDIRIKDLESLEAREATTLTKAVQSRDTALQDVDLALFLNDKPAPARAGARAKPEPQVLQFELDQSDDANAEDAAVWRQLLSGVPQGGKRAVIVGVGPSGAGRAAASWQPGSGKGVRSAVLRVFQPTIAWLAGLGFLLLLGAVMVAGRETALLRDGPTKESRYSLGRVQMAFWTIATVFGFVFIWVLTGQYIHVISTASFTLLGISGATALAATAIEGEPATAKSKSFFADILSDGPGGLQLHRIQVAMWTLVFGGIYVWNVLDQLVLTDFDSNMLVLLGIANGVYAGFKTQEKQ